MIRKVQSTQRINEGIIRLHMDLHIDTHYGQLSIEFFQEVLVIRAKFVIASVQQTFIDQTVELCKRLTNRRMNVLINLVESYYEEFYKI